MYRRNTQAIGKSNTFIKICWVYEADSGRVVVGVDGEVRIIR